MPCNSSTKNHTKLNFFKFVKEKFILYHGYNDIYDKNILP